MISAQITELFRQLNTLEQKELLGKLAKIHDHCASVAKQDDLMNAVHMDVSTFRADWQSTSGFDTNPDYGVKIHHKLFNFTAESANHKSQHANKRDCLHAIQKHIINFCQPVRLADLKIGDSLLSCQCNRHTIVNINQDIVTLSSSLGETALPLDRVGKEFLMWDFNFETGEI